MVQSRSNSQNLHDFSVKHDRCCGTCFAACEDIHEGGFAGPCDPHEAGEHLGPEGPADPQQQLQPGGAALHVHMGSVLRTILQQRHSCWALMTSFQHVGEKAKRVFGRKTTSSSPSQQCCGTECTLCYNIKPVQMLRTKLMGQCHLKSRWCEKCQKKRMCTLGISTQ